MGYENDPGNIQPGKKLFLVIQEHLESVLPYARRQRFRPVLGVKQSDPHRVEYNDDNH